MCRCGTAMVHASRRGLCLTARSEAVRENASTFILRVKARMAVMYMFGIAMDRASKPGLHDEQFIATRRAACFWRWASPSQGSETTRASPIRETRGQAALSLSLFLMARD